MNIPFRRTLITAALAASIVATLAAPAHAAPDDRAMAPSDKDHQTLYWQGHEQLKAGRWEDAAARFAALEEALRRSEPASADAALYWRAYALAKAKRVGAARGALDRLRREFPQSRWMAEVERLQGELGTPRKVDAEQTPLVEAAIEALISAPPERALPLLKRVVEGKYDSRSKQRALFVLSQIDLPEARELVLATARGGDPAVRREAITMLGIGGDPAALEAMYRETDDAAIRGERLGAFLVAGHTPGLLMVAKDTSDPERRREAVHLLGAAGATDALRELLASERDADVLEAVVDALGISGNAALLGELAGDAKRPEALRGKALKAMGIAGAGGELADLYAGLDADSLKQAALEGLLISADGDALRRLYSAAGSDDEKRRILRVLSMLGDDATLDVIEETITQGEGR